MGDFDYSGFYPEKPVKQQRYKSIVVWPDEVSTGKIPNESTDNHRNRRAAEFVCRKIKEVGLGGEGKVFPISTRIEPIEDGEEQ